MTKIAPILLASTLLLPSPERHGLMDPRWQKMYGHAGATVTGAGPLALGVVARDCHDQLRFGPFWLRYKEVRQAQRGAGSRENGAPDPSGHTRLQKRPCQRPGLPSGSGSAVLCLLYAVSRY